MKFSKDLNHYQNLKAWSDYSMSTLARRIDYHSLSVNEKARLSSFNEQLRQIEVKFSSIIDARLVDLQSRVDDPADWMSEFNLSFCITYYLRNDDPEYEEDDDNILMEFNEYFFKKAESDIEWGFGATDVDHADRGIAGFAGENHCYLYQQLIDYCLLDWRDLLRIGDLYVEIKIDEQAGMLPVNRVQI